MQNRSNLLVISLSIACVFFLILSLSLYRHLKGVEVDFNEKKASLVKEGLDLKDRLDSLEEIAKQKTNAVIQLEEERKSLENELKQLKTENEKLSSDFSQLNMNYVNLLAEKKNLAEESDKLKKKYMSLSRKVTELEKSPLVKKIQESIEKENNEEIKKVLQVSLHNIQLIQAGKPVELSPIVVSGKAETATEQQLVGFEERNDGQVLSVDRKNNLVVIDLGRKDRVKEGDSCVILKNNAKLAEGEIISARYKIAAVFINEVKYKNAVTDIEEGDKVLINKK